MQIKSGRIIQGFICFIVFSLSGICVFNPIYRSQNPALSLVFCGICAFIVFELSLFFYSKKSAGALKSKAGFGFFSVLSCIFSLSASLIYLTEIIKDVAFIAGRGVSLIYYTSLGIGLLIVSYYLCYNSQKGIFRFQILTLSPFLILIIGMLFGFFTTKAFFWTKPEEGYISPILTGALTGAFFTFDTGVFINVFRDSLTDENGKICKKTLRYSFTASFVLLCVISLLPFLLFGTHLVTNIGDVQYAAIKLFPGMDLTEALSVVRIISFLIKSSVYIYGSASSIKKVLLPRKNILIYLLAILYSLIPITFLSLAIFDKTMKYGAFQYMIYPIVIILGICFILQNILTKKDDSFRQNKR